MAAAVLDRPCCCWAAERALAECQAGEADESEEGELHCWLIVEDEEFGCVGCCVRKSRTSSLGRSTGPGGALIYFTDYLAQSAIFHSKFQAEQEPPVVHASGLEIPPSPLPPLDPSFVDDLMMALHENLCVLRHHICSMESPVELNFHLCPLQLASPMLPKAGTHWNLALNRRVKRQSLMSKEQVCLSRLEGYVAFLAFEPPGGLLSRTAIILVRFHIEGGRLPGRDPMGPLAEDRLNAMFSYARPRPDGERVVSIFSYFLIGERVPDCF